MVSAKSKEEAKSLVEWAEEINEIEQGKFECLRELKFNHYEKQNNKQKLQQSS